MKPLTVKVDKEPMDVNQKLELPDDIRTKISALTQEGLISAREA